MDDIDELLDSLTVEQVEELEKTLLAASVRADDSPESFAAFYKMMTDTDLPQHAWRWIRRIYEAKSKDRGMVIWGHRGSWKTTTLSIMFTAYRIGKEPHRANLILQNNDKTAQDTTAAIAKLIEHHPGWMRAFPFVVPDRAKGWGALGYEVHRTDIPYPEWVSLNAARKDPTLLGLGYASGSVIGKHPDGVLLIDDIHDEMNTVSILEREKVIQILKSTILPLSIQDTTKIVGYRMVTWMVAVGTPWTDDDAYHYLKDTGEYEFLSTPIMEFCLPGEPGAVEFDHKELQGWFKLLWPERYPAEVITSQYNLSGKREFGRMYLLDLSMADEIGLKYHAYPAEQIDKKWPFSGGNDYASTIEIRGKVADEKNRSLFALCWGAKLPTGGAVIYDGVVGRVTQAEGESHVIKGQEMFPNYATTAVEMNGKGEEFFALLQRHPNIKLLPFWTGGASKKNRHERELSPWLESGLIRISDADTPFLRALRKALKEWPNGNLDVIDAVYAFAKTIPDVLVVPDFSETLPGYMRRQKVKKINPFTAFGQRSRS